MRLAAETRDRLHVVGAVEEVRLAVFHVVQGLEALLHPAVAGRAGADAAASRPVVRAQLLRCLQKRSPFGHFALGLQLTARVVDGDLRHHLSVVGDTEYALRACSDISPW